MPTKCLESIYIIADEHQSILLLSNDGFHSLTLLQLLRYRMLKTTQEIVYFICYYIRVLPAECSSPMSVFGGDVVVISSPRTS